jgi:hypothetical protein
VFTQGFALFAFACPFGHANDSSVAVTEIQNGKWKNGKRWCTGKWKMENV